MSSLVPTKRVARRSASRILGTVVGAVTAAGALVLPVSPAAAALPPGAVQVALERTASGGGALPAWAARPSRTVTVPSSIDATGRADVSAAMQRFVDSVPDGSVIAFPKGARYRMEERLVLRDRNRITIDGNDGTIFATTPGDATRGNLRVEGGSGIVVTNLVVQGANPHAGLDDRAFVLEREHQHGLDFRSTRGVLVDRVTITDTYGDFVYLGALDTKNPWVRDAVIRNSIFTRNGRQGITVTGGRDVVIEHNVMSEMRRATFDFEPGGTPHGADGVTIRNNRIGAGRLMFVAAAGKGRVDNITIEDNHLHGQAMQMIVSDDEGGVRRNWEVVGNRSNVTFGAPHNSAMRFTRVAGIDVHDNVQPLKDHRDMFLARAWSSCRISMTGNTIPGAVGNVERNGSCPG
jgi:polygalacturonase